MVDIAQWITSAGVIGALAVIGLLAFAESGLLIGIFLPGDTLLFTAGFFAAQGHLPLGAVLAVIFVAAVAGDNFGYYFGKQTGSHLFTKKDGLFFRQAYIRQAETFFQKYGAKTIMIARFIPYIRTFAPIVAGAAHMRRPVFIAYNLLGALSWTVITVMLGYWLGEHVPNIERYMLPAVVIAALLLFMPTLWHLLGNRRNRNLLLKEIKAKPVKDKK